MNKAQRIAYTLFGNNISPIIKDDFFTESEQMPIESIKSIDLPIQGVLDKFVHNDGILYGGIRLIHGGEFYFVSVVPVSLLYYNTN